MKRFIIILSSIVGFLVLGAASIPFLVDVNDYRDQIAAVVKDFTGRDLTIDGKISLTIFPWVGIETQRVTFGNSQGFGPAPMVKVDAMHVRVKLAPLFDKRLEADRVVARGLEVTLQRDATGRTNWEDLLKTVASPKEAPGTPPPTGTTGPAAMSGLLISGLSLTDAKVHWDDKVTGDDLRLDKLNLETGQLVPGEPIALTLTSLYSGRGHQGNIDFGGKIKADKAMEKFAVEGMRLTTIINGASYPKDGLDLELKGDLSLDLATGTVAWPAFRVSALKQGVLVVGSLNGQDIKGEKANWQGEITVNPMDLRGTLATLGHPLPPGGNDRSLRAVGLTTKLQAGATAAALTGLELRVDNFNLKGHASVKDFAKPAVQFELKGDPLDLDFFAPATASQSATTAATAASSENTSATRQPLMPLPTLPDDLTIQGSLALASLSGRGVQVVNPKVVIALKDGRLRLDPVEGVLEGKKVLLTALLDGSKTPPRWEATLKSDPLPLRQLLEKAGVALPKTSEGNSFSSLGGTLQASGDGHAATVQRMDLKLDGMSIQGSGGYAVAARPAIQFNLQVDRLNLNHYLPPEGAVASSPGATAAPTAKAQESLIPVALLRSLDLNGSLKIGELQLPKMVVTDFSLATKGSGGLHKLEDLQGKVFQGTFKANATVDARGDTPHVTWQASTRKVQVGLLSQAFLDKEIMTGLANLDSDLKTDGLTKQQLQNNLNGLVKINVADGAIQGIDLVYQIQSAYNAIKGKPPIMEPRAEKTDFAELSGSFHVDKGVVRNDDLKMFSKAITVTGSGLVADLPGDKIDYTTRVNVLTAVGGMDNTAVSDLKGLTIPVTLKGALSNPKVGVALEELLTSAAKTKAMEKVDSIIDKKLGDKVSPELKDGIKGLMKGLKF